LRQIKYPKSYRPKRESPKMVVFALSELKYFETIERKGLFMAVDPAKQIGEKWSQLLNWVSVTIESAVIFLIFSAIIS
jgi:hypothetical protein